jgi:hypothetical protein
MYLQNKYRSCYYALIERAKSRSVQPSIVEKHHIIPKSLGGNNSKENLVSLTPKEHYVCHLLLTKMCEGDARRKMVYAFWALSNLCNKHQERKSVKGRVYEKLRQEFINYQRSLTGNNNPNTGRKTGRTKETFTEEWKAKISASKKGKPTWNKGIPRPDSVKQAVSNANKGKVPWNKGLKNFKEISRCGKSRSSD